MAPPRARFALAFCLAYAVPLSPAGAAGPSRFVLAKGLVAYLEYDGLEAHAAAWEATAARAVLDDTPAGRMIADLFGQVVDRLLRDRPLSKVGGDDAVGLVRRVAGRGAVLAAHRVGADGAAVTAVFPGAGRAEARGRFDRLLRPLVESRRAERVDLRGRSTFRWMAGEGGGGADAGLVLFWWFEADDLVVVAATTPAHAEAVLDAADGKAADASTHPGRLAAAAEGAAVPGFEPDGLFFLEPDAVGVLGDAARRALTLAFGVPRERVGLSSLPGLGLLRDYAQPFEAPPAADGAVTPGPELPLPPPAFLLPPAPPGADAPPPPPPATMPPPLSPAALAAGFARPFLSPEVRRLEPPPGAAVPEPVPADFGSPGERPGRSPARALGLDRVTRVCGRFGFHGKALLSVVRIEAGAPRAGLLACVDVRPFRKDALPPLPPGSTTFTVAGFDPAATYARCVALAGGLLPGAGGGVGRVEDWVRAEVGLEESLALFAQLGPTWTVLPDPGGAADGPTGPAVLASVRDAGALLKALDALAARFNAGVRDREWRADDPGRGVGADAPMVALERLAAPEVGYRLASPSGTALFLGTAWQEWTVLVGEGHAAVAASPGRARAALAGLGRRPAPAAELRAAFGALPDELVLLACVDPAESPWPNALAVMPAFVQFLGNFSGDLVGGPGSGEGMGLLSLLGLPEPGGFRVRASRAGTPTAGQVRERLIPIVLAVAVDDGGLRLIARGALPEPVPPGVTFTLTPTTAWGQDGPKRDLKVKFSAGFRFGD